MANYGSADIKALREKTGAGMMDVKKALEEADGDAAKAEELLRVKGLKAVAKREGRSAVNGLVASAVYDAGKGKRGVLIEVNAETDFVAKNEKFIAMADEILQAAVEAGASDVESVLAAKLGKETVKDRVEGLIAVIVLVATDAAGASVAHDVAVHIAALDPTYLDRESVPADVVEAEERIATETTIAEGKPENAVPKIVQGRMNGFYKSVVLLEQGFARDPKVSVGKIVSDAGGKVTAFARLRVGASAE